MIEMEIYKNLGADKDVIKVYKRCHELWRWECNTCKGYGKWMRLTG